jgi:GT2 family glycosyltransferase
MREVGIVVLNYNGGSVLLDCLASARAQTVPVDVVVADNASRDDSLAAARARFPDARFLAFDRNHGFAGGYDLALAEVPNPWLVLLNNDAFLAPDWVERLLAAAAQRPAAPIWGGKLLLDEPGRTPPRVQSAGACFTETGAAFELGWGEDDRGQRDQPGLTASIPGAALLVRRDAFFALGAFDAAYFAYLEDVDLCWRAWLAGHEVRYEPAAVARHRYGATGGGRDSPFRIRLMQRNRLANMLKHLEARTLPRALAVSAAYDAYRWLEFLLRGRFAAWRAHAQGTAAFWRDAPRLRAERRRIQTGRRLTDRDLRERGLLVSALVGLRESRRLARVAAR